MQRSFYFLIFTGASLGEAAAFLPSPYSALAIQVLSKAGTILQFHTVSPSQRLSWTCSHLPNSEPEQNVKRCKCDPSVVGGFILCAPGVVWDRPSQGALAVVEELC